MFARIGDHEGIGVGGPGLQIDLGRIKVVEVDRADDGLRDGSSQSYRDSQPLARDRVVGADAAQVRAVGQVGQVVAAEPIPLLDEVVAAVIADLEQVRMSAREAR